MEQISKIAKAWLQVARGNTTNEHQRRAGICKDCNHAKYKTYLDFIDDELEDVQGFVCDLCTCPLIAKIRSTDVCENWETK